MNKVFLGLLLGAILGAIDGLTAWFTPGLSSEAGGAKGLPAGERLVTDHTQRKNIG